MLHLSSRKHYIYAIYTYIHIYYIYAIFLREKRRRGGAFVHSRIEPNCLSQLFLHHHHNCHLLDGGLVVGNGPNSTPNCWTLLELVLVEKDIKVCRFIRECKDL